MAPDIQSLLANLKQFFEQEKSQEQPISLDNILNRMELATGMNQRTICRCLKPNTYHKKRGRPEINIDEFDLQAISRKIHQFYQNKEFPTLDKLHAVLKDEINFKASKSKLLKVLKRLGYKYKQKDGRKFLIEKPEITFLRHQFLRKMKKVRETKPSSKIIYLDETWINSNHTLRKCWLDKNGKGGFKSPLGKGPRLVIVHAGSDQGFVPGANLNFITKSKTEDYHDQMNSQHFEEWIDTQLFPNVPANSTIVMDNASYHSIKAEKTPTSNSRKAEMQDWLKQNNIDFPDKFKKKELYTLIQQCKPRFQRYKIDELAKKFGHQILRLPPYHCDLNPEELIWSQVKHHVAKKNKSFKMKDIQKLFEEALENVTPKDWENACRHVMDIEKSYWDKDNICDINIPDIVVKLAEDSDSENSSHTSDDDSD
jgi:hypothetical protein